MALPTTYEDLKAEVAAWLVRDDLTDLIPTFIGQAETRFNRLLRAPEMETVVSTVASNGTITLPTDFLQARSLYLDGTRDVLLEQLSLAQLRDRYPTTEGGSPKNFALQSGTELVLRPVPSEDVTLVLNYYARIPSLSDDAADNWLLLAQPDLYLAGALAEGFAHTRDAESMSLWIGRTNAAINEIQIEGRRKATSGAPLVARAKSVA